MKRNWLLASMISAVIATGGCASIDNMMSSWMGHPFGELVARWGPPQMVMDDGAGGRIFVYTYLRAYTAPGYSTTSTNGYVDSYGNINAYSVTSYQPPQSYGYTAYRMFWINSRGVIYRWAWTGL